LDYVRKLLSYLPPNHSLKPPRLKANREDHLRPKLTDIVPYNSMKAYDIKNVINEIVDHESFLEIHKDFAKNIVVGFARINGFVVGLVCNQPKHLAGSLDIDSS